MSFHFHAVMRKKVKNETALLKDETVLAIALYYNNRASAASETNYYIVQ